MIIEPSQPTVIRPAATPAEIITIRPAQIITVSPTSAVVIEPRQVQTVQIAPSVAVTVAPPRRGAWDERGWTRREESRTQIYEGFYQVGDRQFRGRIETTNGGRNITAFICDPPPEIRRHAHGACFQLIENDWFLLHWARPARNVDDAILYMEKVLDESLNS